MWLLQIEALRGHGHVSFDRMYPKPQVKLSQVMTPADCSLMKCHVGSAVTFWAHSQILLWRKYRQIFLFFFHWHCSPLWALACRTMSFHYFLSATNSLHLLTPSTWRSLSTSSFHPFLGLPLLLVPSSSWVKIFFGHPVLLHYIAIWLVAILVAVFTCNKNSLTLIAMFRDVLCVSHIAGGSFVWLERGLLTRFGTYCWYFRPVRKIGKSDY